MARRQRVVGAVAGLLGAALLWRLIGAAFSTDRGLDLHDEGLYLLAADHGNLRGTWTTPFGWHTRPFFLLSRRSIGSLRTFAVFASVVGGAGLGWVLGRSTSPGRSRAESATRALSAVIGGLAGPMVAASMLRTPGYNWVNLMGLTVAAAGIVAALRIPADAPLRSRAALLPVATIAFGAFFATPGKPTSAIAVAAVGSAVLATVMRPGRLFRVAGLAVVIGVALIVVAVILRVWPADFLSVLRTGSRVPPLHDNQSIGGALRDVLRTPKVALKDLRHVRIASIGLVAAAIGTACAAPRLPRPTRWIPLVACTVSAVGTAAPLPVLGGTSPAYRFAWFGTTNAAVLLVLGSVLHIVAHRREAERAPVRRAVAIVLMLVALTVAFGFGSAMSIYHQAALAVVLLWPAAAVLATSVGDHRSRAVAAAALAVASLAMSITNLMDSRRHPFLYDDIATATSPLDLGRGESLRVDPATAAYLSGLRDAARSAGFCPGARLLGFRWQWSATEQYALQATVPDTLLLTILGYPDPLRVLDEVATSIDPAEWADTWIITTDPASIGADEAAELRAALDRLPSMVGRTFPADFELAAQADGTQLWRPAGRDLRPCRG